MTASTPTNGDHRPAPPRGDPLYEIPLLGDIVARIDRLRYRLPLGRRLNRTEADVLRAQARALRLVANAMDSRATQLDKLERREETAPRITRVTLE